MAIKTMSELDVEGRRVFIRVDLDVPLTPARGVADGTRVRQSVPTIRHAVARGARVVLATHLGQPQGRPHPEYSLEPVGAYLAEVLGQEVFLTDEPVGDGTRKVIADLHNGQVALLENLRFAPGEEANDERFARALSSYADVYVNDAFATVHRMHASVVGMVRHVAQKGIGFLFETELQNLERLLGAVERPFVAVVGGAKVSEKMPLIESLLGRVDALYLGGAVANTFLRARGSELGRSLLDEDKLPLARALLARAQSRDVQVFLPRDLVAAAGTRATSGRVVQAMQLPEDLAALDIGPETARLFSESISQAHTVFWYGPMGVFEAEPFSSGTLAMARAVASTRGGFTVVGGREASAAVHRAGVADRISHISAGGGAALELLEGRKLPGLAALEN
jgi:phosphoglycerate kinase